MFCEAYWLQWWTAKLKGSEIGAVSAVYLSLRSITATLKYDPFQYLSDR